MREELASGRIRAGVDDTGDKRHASDEISDLEQPKRVKLQDGGFGDPDVAAPNAMLSNAAEEGDAPLHSQGYTEFAEKTFTNNWVRGLEPARHNSPLISV